MEPPSCERFTALLHSAAQDVGDARADLMPLIYDKLRALAGRMMQGERGHHTLQPTALAHEAYLRLAGEGTTDPRAEAEFLRFAARAMREVLVDHARRQAAGKRGGDWRRTTLAGRGGGDPALDVDLLALDDALRELAEVDPRQAEIVDMRFFSGMTGQQIADVLGLSRRHVVRELRTAQAWLERAMDGG